MAAAEDRGPQAVAAVAITAAAAAVVDRTPPVVVAGTAEAADIDNDV